MVNTELAGQWDDLAGRERGEEKLGPGSYESVARGAGRVRDAEPRQRRARWVRGASTRRGSCPVPDTSSTATRGIAGHVDGEDGRLERLSKEHGDGGELVDAQRRRRRAADSRRVGGHRAAGRRIGRALRFASDTDVFGIARSRRPTRGEQAGIGWYDIDRRRAQRGRPRRSAWPTCRGPVVDPQKVSTRTAARSRWGTRWARLARGSWGRWRTSASGAAAGGASRRSDRGRQGLAVRAGGRRWTRPSNGRDTKSTRLRIPRSRGVLPTDGGPRVGPGTVAAGDNDLTAQQRAGADRRG